MIDSKCIQRVDHSKIQVKEKGRKATFRNYDRETFLVVRVDGCAITEGKRCDYLVRKVGEASVFTELKGSDVEYACKQILGSLENECFFDCRDERVGFLIVCSQYPKTNTRVLRAKNEAMRLYKAGFHVVPRNRDYDIVRVCAIDGPD